MEKLQFKVNDILRALLPIRTLEDVEVIRLVSEGDRHIIGEDWVGVAITISHKSMEKSLLSLFSRETAVVSNKETIKFHLFIKLTLTDNRAYLVAPRGVINVFDYVKGVLNSTKPEYLMKMRSFYTARFYLLLKEWLKDKNRIERTLTYEEIRKLLSVPFTYRVHDIKVRVLRRAEKEINATDIRFFYRSDKGVKGINLVAATAGKEPIQSRRVDAEYGEFAKYIGKTIVVGGVSYSITEDGIFSPYGGWSVDEIRRDWDRWKVFLERNVR